MVLFEIYLLFLSHCVKDICAVFYLSVSHCKENNVPFKDNLISDSFTKIFGLSNLSFVIMRFLPFLWRRVGSWEGVWGVREVEGEIFQFHIEILIFIIFCYFTLFVRCWNINLKKHFSITINNEWKNEKED